MGPLGVMVTEGLGPVDTLYFTVVTIATMGYGDISPIIPAAPPSSDLEHLAGDMTRPHVLLVEQWLADVAHLKDHYPFLYSLALWTNPFDDNACAVSRQRRRLLHGAKFAAISLTWE